MTNALSTGALLDTAEGAPLDERALRWLIGHGIPVTALASPLAVRSTRARFDSNGSYQPCGLGEFVFILPVPADPDTIFTDLGVVDLVAWSPKSGRIGTRLGNVFGLGSDQVRVAGIGTTGLPIPVHRDPIGWLCNGRRGLVFVDCTVAAFALSGLLLEAEDEAHRRDLIQRLTPLPPTIVVAHRRAAA